MAHLTMKPPTLNMDRVTISLWFRIPNQTVQAVRNIRASSYGQEYQRNEVDFNPVMEGTIPLLVWGTPIETTTDFLEEYLLGKYDPNPTGPYELVYWHVNNRTEFLPGTPVQIAPWGKTIWLPPAGADSGQEPAVEDPNETLVTGVGVGPHHPKGICPPSYIGVNVGYTDRSGTQFYTEPPSLEVMLQSPGFAIFPPPDEPDIIALSFTLVPPSPEQPGFPNPYPQHHEINYGPYTPADDLGRPQWHGNELGSNQGKEGRKINNPEVKIDEWNHLLISWEIIDEATDGGRSKMWCAINDKNINGDQLPAMCDPNLGMGINEHVCSAVFQELLEEAEFRQDVTAAFGAMSSTPFDIPGPSSINRSNLDAINPIEKVEMAELQIFAGMTLDTSDTNKRRAFVDKDGKPVDPKKAAEILKRKPDILLHGESNWKKGKNTGSLGLDEKGKEKASGQFKPLGEITAFDPEPALQKEKPKS